MYCEGTRLGEQTLVCYDGCMHLGLAVHCATSACTASHYPAPHDIILHRTTLSCIVVLEARQDRARQGKAGQGEAGQDEAGQGEVGQKGSLGGGYVAGRQEGRQAGRQTDRTIKAI